MKAILKAMEKYDQPTRKPRIKKPPKINKVDGLCWALTEKMPGTNQYAFSALCIGGVAGLQALFSSRKQAREWIASSGIKSMKPVRVRILVEPA